MAFNEEIRCFYVNTLTLFQVKYNNFDSLIRFWKALFCYIILVMLNKNFINSSIIHSLIKIKKVAINESLPFSTTNDLSCTRNGLTNCSINH